MKCLISLVKVANTLDRLGYIKYADQIDSVLLSLAAKYPYEVGVILINPEGKVLLTNDGDILKTETSAAAIPDLKDQSFQNLSYRSALGFVQQIFKTQPKAELLQPRLVEKEGGPLVTFIMHMIEPNRKIDKALEKLNLSWYPAAALNEMNLSDDLLNVFFQSPYLIEASEGESDPSKYYFEMANDEEVRLKDIAKKVIDKKPLSVNEANLLKNHIFDNFPNNIDITGNVHAGVRLGQPGRPREDDVKRLLQQGNVKNVTTHRGSRPRYELIMNFGDTIQSHGPKDYLVSFTFDTPNSLQVITAYAKESEDRPSRLFGEGYDPSRGGGAHF